MKRCRKCKQLKPEAEFGARKLTADKLSYWCKLCQHAYDVLCRRRAGQLPRAVIRTSTHKRCYMCKLWKPFCDFSVDIQKLDGRTSNCKACQKLVKQRQSQLPNYIATRRRRCAWRRRHEPQYRIKDVLYASLKQALRKRNIQKTEHTLDLVGCSIADLVKHLERQFKPGMSWDNYGIHGWHIHHRKPSATFDLTKLEQRRTCFHYTNLTPMWEKEHRKLSADARVHRFRPAATLTVG